MEQHIIVQVQNRIKTLLFNDKIMDYREHEYFISSSGQKYCFLIWKHRPENWGEYRKEIQHLHEKRGYQSLTGACDVSTYNPQTKTGYKVLALYKPDEK